MINDGAVPLLPDRVNIDSKALSFILCGLSDRSGLNMKDIVDDGDDESVVARDEPGDSPDCWDWSGNELRMLTTCSESDRTIGEGRGGGGGEWYES